MRFMAITVISVSLFALVPSILASNNEHHFGAESQIKASNTTGWEDNQDLCVDSKGYLYMAWENKSLMASNYGIALYRSVDSGLSWTSIGYLYNPDADLRQPSIAVGEGLLNRVIVAYMVDEGYGKTYPEAAYAPLGSTSFVTTPLPVSSTSYYSAPELWTDASQMNIWRAYIVCSEIKPAGNENSVVTWRSDKYASAWQPRVTVMGGSLTTAWSRAHAAFGTPSKVSFIICCRQDKKRIEMVYTDDFGASYSSYTIVETLATLPWSKVDLQIAAARTNHNLMVCFCERIGDYDELMYMYSPNSGSGWSSRSRIPGWGSYSRFGPELAADAFGGHGFHLTCTRQAKVYHHYLRDDLVGGWTDPHLVCGDGYASHADTKKGIACHPVTNAAFICWCDMRDGGFDTDTFFNYSGSLVASDNKVSASGGGLSFLYLYAGAENAGRTYLILAGVTGTKPGLPLPGGKAVLPINWDLFTDLALSLVNTSAFQNFYGTLDYNGNGGAALKTPPLNPAYVGVVMYFAYCLNNPFDFASNAIAIEIVS